MLEERNACYHVANAFLQPPSRLELNNGPYLGCKSLKYPKMHIWQKASGVNGLG